MSDGNLIDLNSLLKGDARLIFETQKDLGQKIKALGTLGIELSTFEFLDEQSDPTVILETVEGLLRDIEFNVEFLNKLQPSHPDRLEFNDIRTFKDNLWHFIQALEAYWQGKLAQGYDPDSPELKKLVAIADKKDSIMTQLAQIIGKLLQA